VVAVVGQPCFNDPFGFAKFNACEEWNLDVASVCSDFAFQVKEFVFKRSVSFLYELTLEECPEVFAGFLHDCSGMFFFFKGHGDDCAQLFDCFGKFS